MDTMRDVSIFNTPAAARSQIPTSWGTETQGAATACHGQYSFDITASNWVEFNNVYRDITGTAVFTMASFSGITGVVNNAQFYNNVFYNSSPAASWAPFLSDGVISCIANSGTGETMQCSNITMSQNDFVNLSGQSGINNDCTDGCGSGSSYTVQNNIWYSSVTPAFTTAAAASYTQGYNSCLASGTCPTGTNNVTATSPPNPFVSWTTGNFNLASENSDWSNRAALGALYTLDATGAARTTDRGAYQFVSLSTSGTPPTPTSVEPPTNLTATAQ